MKEEKKTKSAEKSQRKEIRKSIEPKLVSCITEALETLGVDKKKLKKEIAKASKLLAKRASESAKLGKKEKSSPSREEERPSESAVSSISPNEETQSSVKSQYETAASTDGLPTADDAVKRPVQSSTRNVNIDPIALAENTAKERTAAGVPALDEQLGVS